MKEIRRYQASWGTWYVGVEVNKISEFIAEQSVAAEPIEVVKVVK